MRRMWFSIIIMVCLVHEAAAEVPRQSGEFRDGVYAGVAVGVGSLALTSNHLRPLPSDRELSGTLGVRVGAALLPRLLLGVHVGGWTKKIGASWYGGEQDRVSIAHLSGEVTYYPVLDCGGFDVYLSAGAGVSHERYSFLDNTMSENGSNFHGGVGVEKRLSQGLAVGLSLNASSHLTLEESSDYFNVALGVTWY